MSAPCPHLYVIDRSFGSHLLAEERESSCDWCGVGGSDHWMCLFTGCMKIGCGVALQDHSAIHYNNFPSHCVTINLRTRDAWCFMCEINITPWILARLNNGQHLGGAINASGVPLARPVTPPDSNSEEEEGEEDVCREDEECAMNESIKPRGLVGLRNLGLTCYMNAALQALSNTMPLTQFMLDFPIALRNERKNPGLSRLFQKSTMEIWHPKQPSCVTPLALYQGFRQLYPMFRTYSQQDSQEFLRYFMDQIHEELREPVVLANDPSENTTIEEEEEEDVSSIENISEQEDSHSEEEDYETCDSGVSEHSVGSGSSYQSKPKRKKKHHPQDVSLWANYASQLSAEQEGSDFSDAVSESSLLDSRLLHNSKSQTPSNVTTATITSGLGSSKPSMSSLNSNYRPVSQSSVPSTSGKQLSLSTMKKKKTLQYHSIISDVFDGILVSSVQCLTCNTISSRRETFQDLSLPIPSLEQLSLLQQQSFHHHHHHHLHLSQQQQHTSQVSSSLHLAKSSCDAATDGWMWWMWSWLRSWFWGPTVSLHHCLAAFFSADELKGDNMYSCEKCGKLRNGIKYSKMLQLPEVLIIHLKRFRHEYLFSSKISQYVSFPLQGLDLTPFLHKDCHSETKVYDLYAVICHHGFVGGGHYTCYAQNWTNYRWYEFDDQCVTEVSPETVANSEAYVLFYKKSSIEMISRRQRTIELMQVSSREPSLMKFYVSKQWINKFNTFSEPGPIDNSDFLCPHGGVQPLKTSYVSDLVVLFSQGVWEYLHQVFGGGPVCTQLYECVTCKEELEALLKRQSSEFNSFIILNGRFQEDIHPNTVYAISMRWFRIWEGFVRGRQQETPPPVDNSSICVNKNGQPTLKLGSDYAPISEEIWNFFYDIYGGGPELCIRYGTPSGVSKRADKSDETTPNLENQSRDVHSDEELNTKQPQVFTPPLVHTSGRQRTASASEAMRVSRSNSPCLSKNRRVSSVNDVGTECSTDSREEHQSMDTDSKEAISESE